VIAGHTDYKSGILNGGKAEKLIGGHLTVFKLYEVHRKKRFAIPDIKWLADLSEVL
jgi:hypothetical protein